MLSGVRGSGKLAKAFEAGRSGRRWRIEAGLLRITGELLFYFIF